DAQLGNRSVKAGDRVGWMIASANRDPDEFPDARDFDLHRERNRHLAFGAGVHRCIGSNFARASLRVLFTEMLARYSKFSIAEGESVDWVSRGSGVWYVARRIPATLELA